MKIVQITAVPETVEAFLFPLITKLIEKGHEIDVITSDSFSKLKNNAFILNNKISVYDVDIPRKFSPWGLFKAYSTMYELFKGLKPDVIHTHSPFASLIARRAASGAKVPNIINTSHGFYFTDNMNWFKKHFFQWLEKSVARKHTDYLFTVNSEDMDYALKHNFIDKDRIINLQSIGVDTKIKFNPLRIHEEIKKHLRDELNIAENDKVFTFTGRIVEEKGIIDLLQAFAMINKKYANSKLLLIGETPGRDKDEAFEEKIQTLIRTNKLENVCLRLGFRADIPELLSITDVFVLPSNKEGMPISSLEALSMGIPVVGTNIRGLREEVIEGKTGYLVPLQKIRELSVAMEKAMNNFSKPDSNCRKQAIENFDEEDVIKKQLDIYATLEKNITETQDGGIKDESH